MTEKENDLSALQAAPSEGAASDPWRVVLSEVEASLRDGITPEEILAVCRRAAPSEGGEPVAWVWEDDIGDRHSTTRKDMADHMILNGVDVQPAYARPPAPSEGPLVGWRPFDTILKDGSWIVVLDRYLNPYTIRWDETPIPGQPERGPRGWKTKGGYSPDIRIEPDVILGWAAAPAPDAIRGGEK